MQDTLGVFNGYVIYNDDEYDDLDILIDKIGDKQSIVIFDKSILVKIYEFKNKPKNLISEINNKIQEDIPLQDDILIHYDYDNRNNKLLIYYMSGGAVIDKVCTDAKKLDVVPIQFIIKKYVEKNIKKQRKYMIVAKIKNEIYVIRVNENYIVDSQISNKINEIINIINAIDEDEMIIIDNKLAEFINESINFSLNCMIIGENIYDRLFKTKKLFTKELFRKKKLKLQR